MAIRDASLSERWRSVAVRSSDVLSRPRASGQTRGGLGALMFPRGTFCGTICLQKGSQIRRFQKYEHPFLVSSWSLLISRTFRGDPSDPFAWWTMTCQITTELTSREILGSSGHSVLPAKLPAGPVERVARAQSWQTRSLFYVRPDGQSRQPDSVRAFESSSRWRKPRELPIGNVDRHLPAP